MRSAKFDNKIGKLRVASKNRYLEFDEEHHFSILEIQPRVFFHRMDLDQAQYYLRNRAAKGFIVIQSAALDQLVGLDEPNPFGELTQIDKDPSQSNDIYFAQVSTDDVYGKIRAYTGEGKLTDDPLDTFGHRAVVYVPKLQDLMQYVCKNGFEHHVAMTMGNVSSALNEAFITYMEWENHHHY